MSTDALKPAIFEGPFVAHVTDRHSGQMTELRPGDEWLVTDADLESTFWRAIEEPKPKRGKRSAAAAESKQQDSAVQDGPTDGGELQDADSTHDATATAPSTAGVDS